MDAKIVKLDSIEKRYLEIGEEMLKDDVVSNVKAFTKLSKEQATLKGAYDAYQEYKKLNSDIEGAKEMLNDSDPELKEMAQMEYDEASEKLEKLCFNSKYSFIFGSVPEGRTITLPAPS